MTWAKELIKQTPLYSILRPRVAARRARMRKISSEFVSPGSLVFDVGANRGEYSALYLALGARVVAIEPNGDVIPSLRARAGGAVIETVAVGEVAGDAELHIAPSDVESTLSTRYANGIERRPGIGRLPTRVVPVTTLDALAARHGVPDFVKIDVEGFEAPVIRGMTFRPPALSFEFHGLLLNELRKSLDLLPEYRFRLSIGFSYSWATEWVDAAAAMATARRLAPTDPNLFGDVYCRLSTGAQRRETAAAPDALEHSARPVS